MLQALNDRKWPLFFCAMAYFLFCDDLHQQGGRTDSGFGDLHLMQFCVSCTGSVPTQGLPKQCTPPLALRRAL